MGRGLSVATEGGRRATVLLVIIQSECLRALMGKPRQGHFKVIKTNLGESSAQPSSAQPPACVLLLRKGLVLRAGSLR